MQNNISKPSSVQMAITYRCNLRCLHCDIWKMERNEELSYAQWVKIFKKLKDWLGPFRLDISGGEPFLRKDISDIIEFCDKNEIQSVVTSNATLLETRIIKKLSQIKSLTLNISLDGVNANTHDFLRNIKGVYNKVMDTLLKFKKNGRECHITMATILMGYNIEEILPLIKKLIVDRLADAINFQALDCNFQAPYSATWFKNSQLWPSSNKKETFLSILDGIIRIKKAGAPIYNPVEQLMAMREYFNNPEDSIIKAICNTGDVNFIMNPNADVLLCWNMAPVGNALKESPDEIWRSSAAIKRRSQITKCPRTCRILNCNYGLAGSVT